MPKDNGKIVDTDASENSDNITDKIASYENAILLGDPTAMVNRALMHQRGEGGPVNIAAAIALYEQAIALGNSDAMTNLGSIYQYGENGSVNSIAAISLYDQAIALGNAVAMNKRAFMHYTGEGGPIDFPAAIALYDQAIALKNADAMNGRAWMHHTGEGGPIDFRAAVALYEQAIALGNTAAMVNRGWMHQYGEGGVVNTAAAIALYEQASELGDPNAMHFLGTAYYDGIGVEVDLEEAAKYFQKSAELGHIQANYFYGYCLLFGIGVAQDKELGMTHLRMAADANDENAINLVNDLAEGKLTGQVYEEAMIELESMIGLDEVKRQVKRLINRMQLCKLRQEHNLPSGELSLHLVFTGNPGTGKTTVARILGHILKGIGLLEKGHVVETGQADLISGFVGHTAIQVKQKIEEAMGGILFIDEAYGLVGHETSSGGDFGSDAINTLLKLMEDHRDKFVVIAAGYTNEMQGFINSNPGLKSRFTNTIEFADFNRDELVKVFLRFSKVDHYQVTDETISTLSNLLDLALSREIQHFSNGRFVRNIYQESLMNMASRVANLDQPSKDDLVQILPEDIPSIDDVSDKVEAKKPIGFIH